mgnify:CR=1 FL=1
MRSPASEAFASACHHSRCVFTPHGRKPCTHLRSCCSCGIHQLCRDSSVFKTIYPSHWGEVLRLIGKFRPPRPFGHAYVGSKLTQTDSMQILNGPYLRWLLTGIDWCGHHHYRIDDFVRQSQIYVRGSRKSSGAKVHTTDFGIQTMLVPLRELCRKFDGYDTIPVADVPQLVLPPSANRVPLNRTASAILRLATAFGSSRWTEENYFEVPNAWFEQSLSLYGLDPALARLPFKHSKAPAGTLEYPMRELSGFCGSTLFSSRDECRWNVKGAWELGLSRPIGGSTSKMSIWTKDDCVAACRLCSNCNFVSFSTSPGHRECAWYNRCDMDRLMHVKTASDYITVAVSGHKAAW